MSLGRVVAFAASPYSNVPVFGIRTRSSTVVVRLLLQYEYTPVLRQGDKMKVMTTDNVRSVSVIFCVTSWSTPCINSKKINEEPDVMAKRMPPKRHRC